jgi:transcriptional regulator with XRE-family HTH domain
MDSEQKIEERKRWNEPFLRAFNYLLDENYAFTKGELCKMVGIEPGLISRYNNGTKKVSIDTMNALARVSEGRLNVNYMLGKSDYMLIANVPDDEILNSNNPDREVIEKRKQEERGRKASSIDESSQMNASIAAYVQLTNRMSDDLKKKEIEMQERLAEKDATIESQKAQITRLELTIADKDTIIKEKEARIVALERHLASFSTSDIEHWPFSVGVADEGERQRSNV